MSSLKPWQIWIDLERNKEALAPVFYRRLGLFIGVQGV